MHVRSNTHKSTAHWHLRVVFSLSPSLSLSLRLTGIYKQALMRKSPPLFPAPPPSSPHLGTLITVLKAADSSLQHDVGFYTIVAFGVYDEPVIVLTMVTP